MQRKEIARCGRRLRRAPSGDLRLFVRAMRGCVCPRDDVASEAGVVVTSWRRALVSVVALGPFVPSPFVRSMRS